MCPAALRVLLLALLGKRIESELPKQVKLGKNVPLKVIMKEAGKDIRILPDKVKIRTELTGKLDRAAPDHLMSRKYKLGKKIRTEFQPVTVFYVVIYIGLRKQG